MARLKTADMATYRREYMRGWRDENRERVRELDRESRERRKTERDARRALPENRTKNSAATAAYRKRLGPEALKDQRLRQKYGISLADYNRMLDEQAGHCPICGDFLVLTHPHVDHDHETGEVRAILCGLCNQAIGMLRESPRTAENLAKYLREHGKDDGAGPRFGSPKIIRAYRE